MNTILFGDLPLATMICKLLLNDSDINLEAIVIGNPCPHNNDPFNNIPLLKDFAKQNNLKIIKFDEIEQNYQSRSVDLGISCRFSRIFRREQISIFKKGVINFHGGLLPEYGGLYSSVHELLEGAIYGGGTLHYITENIDEGDIIQRCEFPIDNADVGLTIFQKTQIALYENFKAILPEIKAGNVKSIDANELIRKGYLKRYFNKSSLNGKREVNIDALMQGAVNEINRIRAFEFADYEHAYFYLNRKKIYLHYPHTKVVYSE